MEENLDSTPDLTGAVREALVRRGVYSNIKAKLRAEVFHALEDKSVTMPDKPKDVFLAAELVRDFLQTLHFDNSSSVFCEESGQPPQMAVDRTFLSNELGFNLHDSQQSSGVPVLVLLINQLRHIKEQHDIDLMSSVVANADE